MNIVETNSLKTKLGVKMVLNDINLTIASKEHTILFGLNGSGKTSLLATICGYMGYTSGKINLLGELVTDTNVLELRKQVGFVSNSYFDRCFKRENALNIVLSGVYGQLAERYDISSKDVKKAKALLKGFDLKEKMAYPYDLLSRGQQQKVLIARALMVEPKLLLLDEPCSGLDVLSRQYLLNTITQIAQESDATVICATHYEEEILPFYKRAILIKRGTIYADDAIETIFTPEQLSGFFEKKVNCNWKNGRVRLSIHDDYRISKQVWM